MHDRSALGSADVTDDVLTSMVADLLGVADVDLVSSTAREVPYDMPAITTAGRYWVSGRAAVDGEVRDWTLFVKHVQSWTRSPFFAFVPDELKELAAVSVPWRTEAAIYSSDLADHLPAGLHMPRALGVFDLDELAQAVWLEPIVVSEERWDLDRYENAAYLLGRLAASPAVRPYADIGGNEWSVDSYVGGRLAGDVLPALRDEAAWPATTLAAFADVRPRLLAVADRIHDLGAELAAVPTLTGHGDACPNNLLLEKGREGFTLIDFGFWNPLPLGFDLGQLLVGDVQMGRHAADDLAERDLACVRAYHRGLAAEGYDVPLAVVRRAHAVHLMLFSGISTFVGGAGVAEDHLASRAALARYSLDLLDATAA